MKSILIMFAISYAGLAHAQIAIQKEMADEDGLLDFAENTTNGILLPIVETLPGNAVAGTLLMDKNDKTLKMNTGTEWASLSDAGSIADATFNVNPELSGTNRIIIGAAGTNAPGVLVLESSDKALILPKIATPHTSVKNPYPGMICYDTASKTLAVFDGLKWSYWK